MAENEKNQLTSFTGAARLALPIILLADVSGSMSVDGKIEALNASVRDMLSAFASNPGELRAEIQVAIITFGGEVRMHTPLQPAAQVAWVDMDAGGETPMGKAMGMAAELIEDKDKLPSKSYRPMVVLISDGQPNDPGWEEGLERITNHGRAKRAQRMALAIGADADVEMMRRFVSDVEKQVFYAADARRIHNFFRLLKTTVTVRSQSADPNAVPDLRPKSPRRAGSTDVPSLQDPYDIDTR